MKHDIYKLADQYHLSESDQLLLQAVLDAVEQQAQYSVREFAARNYVSPAAVIRLSKKLGYTGYTDMIYRLGFLVRNGDRNKAHTSDINSFIGEIPPGRIETFLDRLSLARQRTVLVAGTGFCEPLRDFFVRKLLVMGYPTVGTNSYEVYETNALNAGLMIVISKSGTTDTIQTPRRRHCGVYRGGQLPHCPKRRPHLPFAGRQHPGRPQPDGQLFLRPRADFV